MKSLILALVLCLSAAPVLANEVSSDTVVPEMTKAEKKMVPLVRDYVRNKRGWMDGIYVVEFSGYEDELAVFTVVVTGDDPRHLVRGNGETFQVLVDPVKKTVKGERFF